MLYTYKLIRSRIHHWIPHADCIVDVCNPGLRTPQTITQAFARLLHISYLPAGHILPINQESATLLAPSLNNGLIFICEAQTHPSQPTATHVLTAFHIAASSPTMPCGNSQQQHQILTREFTTASLIKLDGKTILTWVHICATAAALQHILMNIQCGVHMLYNNIQCVAAHVVESGCQGPSTRARK